MIDKARPKGNRQLCLQVPTKKKGAQRMNTIKFADTVKYASTPPPNHYSQIHRYPPNTHILGILQASDRIMELM